MADKDLKGDEGALLMRMAVKDEHLIIEFHEPTTWMALHKEQVDQMIAMLQAKRKLMV